jgi:hypothetical protein
MTYALESDTVKAKSDDARRRLSRQYLAKQKIGRAITPQGARFNDGSSRPTYDIILHRRQE